MSPKVFIGSSSESLELALAIQANFNYYELFATVWTQGIFKPSNFTVEDLLEQLESCDFGIFIFAPDDILKIREKELGTVRDNVLFEMGLFVGKLGRERTFFVTPHNHEPLRLASDLLGLKPATYNINNPDKRAALGVACEEIREKIRAIGPRFRLPEPLPHLATKARVANESSVHLYTFLGLHVEQEPDPDRKAMVGLNSVYRLWADPTSHENYIQSAIVLDHEPNFYRVEFRNSIGSYPSNITIRPCGLYPLVNYANDRYLALDARAIPPEEKDSTNRCSKEIGLSFRLIDGLATMWDKGIASPLQMKLPVDGKWRTFHLDLTKEWFLFTSDGNHYYASDRNHVDFSIISAVEIEFGSMGGPRLGVGHGSVDITNIRFCNKLKK